MPATEPRRSLDELSRLAKGAYDRLVLPTLRPEDDGKFVVFDIETGDHEIDDDDYTAVSRLRSRKPTAELWIERAGQPAAYKIRWGR